jgi:spore coat polysaccharide biosynthesis protein SpsF
MKFGSLIPIRLASERLPGKAIKKVCGKPLVCHLLDRVFSSKYIKNKLDVVVCTTKDRSDDILVDIVENYGASVFRGSTDDIIKRFYEAILKYDFDYIIQVDGDDILCATEYMDLTMDALIKDDSLDIVTCVGLPLGVASKSFTKNAIKRVFDYYQTNRNDTGFIYYFTKTGLCNQKTIEPISDEHVLNSARLTLDYQEDLDVFTNVIQALYPSGVLQRLDKIVAYLRSNREISKINNNLDEEYWKRTKEKAQLYFRDQYGHEKKIIV